MASGAEPVPRLSFTRLETASEPVVPWQQRWVCVISGSGALALGLAALAYVLWAPFYRKSGVTPEGSSQPATTTRGLLEEGMEWPVAVLLGAILLLLCGVAIGSILNVGGSSCGTRPALLIRSCAMALTIIVGITFVAIGGFFAPAAVAAVISAFSVGPGSRAEG